MTDGTYVITVRGVAGPWVRHVQPLRTRPGVWCGEAPEPADLPASQGRFTMVNRAGR
jgi:hypothetical protein